MIHPRNDSIYLSGVTFSELNAFSQNYLPFWPNTPFEVADLLRLLVVKELVVFVAIAMDMDINSGNSIREN